MFEMENTFTALVIVSIGGRFVDGPPVDAHFTVGAVSTYDGDLRRSYTLFHQDTSLFERQRSRI